MITRKPVAVSGASVSEQRGAVVNCRRRRQARLPEDADDDASAMTVTKIVRKRVPGERQRVLPQYRDRRVAERAKWRNEPARARGVFATNRGRCR